MCHFKTWIFSTYLLFLVGCATQQHTKMQKLKVGMDKTDVLDLIGNPNSSKFKDGEHVWLYIYYKDETKLAKKLWFKKDQLVRLENYDFNAEAPNLKIDDQEIEDYKKAAEEKQRRQQDEREFQDID